LASTVITWLMLSHLLVPRANGTTILEEWDNGKRVEAKKETIANDHEEPEDGGRRPEAVAPSVPATVPSSAPENSAAEASGHDHSHGQQQSHDHELDPDLGDLPTLWYGETHQIQTNENLTPNQGRI